MAKKDLGAALAARSDLRLGRGEQVSAAAKEFLTIAISEDKEEISVFAIKPSSYQPRIEFDKDELFNLAGQIEETNGVVQPIVVRRISDDPDFDYELLAGERRLRAVRDILKWDAIDAVIRDCDDGQALLITTAENLGRKDLSDFEKSRTLLPLMELGVAKSPNSLARIFGESERNIQRLFLFHSLPEAVIQLLEKHPKLITAAYIEEFNSFLKRGHINLVVNALELVVQGKLKTGKTVLDWIARHIRGPKAQVEKKIFDSFGTVQATLTFSKGVKRNSLTVRTEAKSIDSALLESKVTELLNELLGNTKNRK